MEMVVHINKALYGEADKSSVIGDQNVFRASYKLPNRKYSMTVREEGGGSPY